MSMDERIRVECRQCCWAASSTDPHRLDDAADIHEKYFPDHRVYAVDHG